MQGLRRPSDPRKQNREGCHPGGGGVATTPKSSSEWQALESTEDAMNTIPSAPDPVAMGGVISSKERGGGVNVDEEVTEKERLSVILYRMKGGVGQRSREMEVVSV